MDDWVARINTREMPALTSTVRMLETLAQDETSSLRNLGKSVMHDSALTSAILRVANSASYMGVNRVTTVTRAAVVLGFKAIKNICITTKLLDSLLRNKDLTPPVYNRLLKLMARSFHAAILAKLMMSAYDEDTQEEAFIAALLYNLGESAFWSVGGQITEQLDQKLTGSQNQAEQIIRETLGVTFAKITIGLARTWNLSDILIQSLNDPRRRTPELQVIHQANRCSELLAAGRPEGEQWRRLQDDMCQLMGVNKKVLWERLAASTKEAQELLSSYQAHVLIPYIPTVDQGGEFHGVSAQTAVIQADEAYQLKTLRKLTFMATEKADFSKITQTTLQGLYRGLGMDRVIFLMINASKRSLVPRQLLGEHSESLRQTFVADISDGHNVFYYVMKKLQPVMVSDHRDSDWQGRLPAAVKKMTSDTGFFLAPAVFEQQCLGIFYVDCAESHRSLTQGQFATFTHFVQLSNLCLAFSLKK